MGHILDTGKTWGKVVYMCRYTILPYFAELTYSIMHVGRKAYVQIHPLAVNCKEISDTHRYGKKMYVADTPLCHISRSSLAQSLCWKKGVSCRYTFLPKTVEHSISNVERRVSEVMSTEVERKLHFSLSFCMKEKRDFVSKM